MSRKVCCIGAGYVGGPTMAVLALKNPDIEFTVCDVSQYQIEYVHYANFHLGSRAFDSTSGL